MDYLGFGECKPMRLLPKLIPNPPSVTRTTRFNSSGVPLPPMSTTPLPPPTATETPIVLKRDCTVDVDPKHQSDRREWATAHYHSFYNPHCLFELEIRWLVATSCILGDLISQWSVRTGTILGSNQVAFHLVPIPCDPFAEFDALRGNSTAAAATGTVHSPRRSDLHRYELRMHSGETGRSASSGSDQSFEYLPGTHRETVSISSLDVCHFSRLSQLRFHRQRLRQFSK